MGEALFELEQFLRSTQYKMSREEATVLQACKAKAIRDFTVTASVVGGAVWTAMWRFGLGYKFGLSTGAGLFSGMWRFEKSLNVCVDKILAMEGSRLQSELANIILTRHQRDLSRMQLIKKHFYMERVFDDSSQDVPKARWRFRSYFGDSFSQSQSSNDSGSVDDSADTKPRPSADTKPRQFTEPKQFNMTPAVEVTADPLDCIFGHSGLHEEIHHPNNTTEGPPKRRSRHHKKTHRRHRACHTGVSE